MLQSLAWLEAWLQEYEQDTREGYRVEPLSDDAVDALDGEDRAVARMIGVVTGNPSAHPVADATYAMVAVDQEQVHPGRYEDYQVDYLSDLGCFLDLSCDRLELTEDYTANLILGVRSTNHTHNEYLWLEPQAGLAMVHRAWLPDPPEVNLSWLAVLEQFYLDVFLPWPGGHFRVQATWMVYDQQGVPEDTVMTLVIAGMQAHSEELEAWLDAN